MWWAISKLNDSLTHTHTGQKLAEIDLVCEKRQKMKKTEQNTGLMRNVHAHTQTIQLNFECEFNKLMLK